MRYPVPQDKISLERARRKNVEANEIRARPCPPLIVPADVDDAGLTPHQFRVLCHVARRCGKDGMCYSSIETMAKVCRIRPKTVRASLSILVDRGLLSRKDISGKTSEFRIVSNAAERQSSWKRLKGIND